MATSVYFSTSDKATAERIYTRLIDEATNPRQDASHYEWELVVAADQYYILRHSK